MPKILKIPLTIIAMILLLVTVIIGGIYLFVDPNEYKNEITTAVHETTGRQLTIAGDIKLSIYPWLGLSLGATQLSNAKGFGDTPFISVESVDIKVKLLPLLQQRLEMQKIRLHGLRASLAKNKDGHSNWDDLSPPSTPTPKATTEAPGSKQNNTDPNHTVVALAALAIDGLELEDAYLDWRDQQADQHIVISHLTVRTGPLALSDPIDLSLSLDASMDNPKMDGHVDLAGQIAFDLETQQYQANKLNLTVKATGSGLPVSPFDARILANVKADLKKQQVSIGNLDLNALGIKTTGQITITELDKSPVANGAISTANFSPKDVSKRLGIILPNTSDTTVLSKTKVDISFTGTMDEARLTKITAVLDDTRLSGTASLKNFTSPAIRFDLTLDDIDVDRYLPPTTETATATTPTSPGTAAAAATQLPLEPLRTLNIDGKFSLGKLKIAGAHLSDISLDARSKGGQINLNPVKAKLYQGSYKGRIAMDVRTDTPKLTFIETLDGVNAGPLLKDVLGKDLISGKANVTAQLTATGTELESIKKTLNGKAKFSFKNGVVKGVNINQMIREANAKLNKKPAPPKTTNETDFAEMSGSVTVTNGIVRNKDMAMKSPLLRIHGKGNVDLPREKIKYLVNTSIVESNEGQTGKELEDLKSLTIPIKVTGTFDHPKYGLDLGPVLQARAKKAVKKQQKRIEKKAEKEIKKKVEDELKKLFKF